MNQPYFRKTINPDQYARLKSEIANPYKGLRQFLYLGFGASALIGAFIFCLQILSGRNLGSAAPNFALQLSIFTLMLLLWRWERRGKDGKKGN